MDTAASTFTARGNAKRAAERMIANGTAPAVNYDIRLREDERFEIVWNTAPTTGEVEAETAAAAPDREDGHYRSNPLPRSTATRTIWHPKRRLMRSLLPLRMSPQRRTPRRRAQPQRIINGQTVPA